MIKALRRAWHDLGGHTDVVRHMSAECWPCSTGMSFCRSCEAHFETSHPPIGGFGA